MTVPFVNVTEMRAEIEGLEKLAHTQKDEQERMALVQAIHLLTVLVDAYEAHEEVIRGEAP